MAKSPKTTASKKKLSAQISTLQDDLEKAEQKARKWKKRARKARERLEESVEDDSGADPVAELDLDRLGHSLVDTARGMFETIDQVVTATVEAIDDLLRRDPDSADPADSESVWDAPTDPEPPVVVAPELDAPDQSWTLARLQAEARLRGVRPQGRTKADVLAALRGEQ